MTHYDSTPTFRDRVRAVLERVRSLVPKSAEGYGYSVVSGIVMFLMALGVVNNEEAALWTQLAIALVTCLFALIYSPSTWRASLYLIVGPLGAVLMGYGLVAGEKWAIIVAASGQVLGITTAAVASGRPMPATTPKLAPLMSLPSDRGTQRS